MQPILSPAWAHGKIRQIFDNIFMVTGTNIIIHDGVRIQTSRNMIITRQDGEVTLINSVRLNEDGIKSLEELGQIKNIIRIGAFHGRDDAYYQNSFGAHLWAFPSMDFSHNERLDFDLTDGKLPIADAKLFSFKSTNLPEGLILIDIEGGILISCDSIKNWIKKDEFFDEETFDLMKRSGAIGEAKIDTNWLQAMNPSKSEVEKISKLQFSTLLSAHGEVLKGRARLAVEASIRDIWPTLRN